MTHRIPVRPDGCFWVDLCPTDEAKMSQDASSLLHDFFLGSLTSGQSMCNLQFFLVKSIGFWQNRLPFHYTVCRQRTKGRLTTSKVIINHHLSVLSRSIPIFFYALVLTISYQLCQLCLHTFHCIDQYYLYFTDI